MIRYENVTKKYDRKIVVDSFNFNVNKGEFVVFIGPSGCGKTTTLKMTNRLIKMNIGKIHINGENINKVDPIDLRRKIGYVIQQIGLFPNMTIKENISTVPRLLGWNKVKCNERVHELLEMVDMPYDEYALKFPNELSGGQQQRVGVLRALAGDPPIILMDEPFGALDPITRDNLQDEFKSLQKRLHKTIVFVTHDMSEAIKMADRIVFMSEGKVLQAATPEELLSKPATSQIREFLGKHMPANDYDLSCGDVMRKKILTVLQTQKTLECIELMNQKDFNSCIVVDENKKLVGTVSVERIFKEGKPGEDISRLIKNNVVTVKKEDSAKKAFEILENRELDYLVVLSDKNEVAGIITRSSMTKALASVVWGDER